jgi:hypothetical protein
MTPIALLAAAVLGLAASAAPTFAAVDGLATETRELSGFTAISLRGGIDLVVRQGAQEAVQVSAGAKLLSMPSATVEGSGDSRTLHIQWKPDEWLRSKARADVTVDVVRLTAVSAGGSGDIKIGALNTPTFALSIAGSGDVDHSGAALTKGAIAGSGTIRQRK